ADGRPDIYPAQTAIGNLAARSAHILASGEVQVMWGHLQLPTADPELEKPWIDIHQRGAPEASQQRRAERAEEVQEQIGLLKDGFGLITVNVEVLSRLVCRAPIAARNIHDALTGQPVSLPPSVERRKRR